MALECILFLFSQQAWGNQAQSVCGEAGESVPRQQELLGTIPVLTAWHLDTCTWLEEFVSGAVNGLLCSDLRGRVRWGDWGRFGFLQVSGEFEKQNQSLLRNLMECDSLCTPAL